MATNATAPTAIPAIAPLLSPFELAAAARVSVADAAALVWELVAEALELDGEDVDVPETVAIIVAGAVDTVPVTPTVTTAWMSITAVAPTLQHAEADSVAA